MARHTCPHHGAVKPATNGGAIAVLAIAGFFTCGIAWFLIPVVVLAGAIEPKCPICDTVLHKGADVWTTP